MNNYAGRDDIDEELTIELTTAGIPTVLLHEILRKSRGEVKSIVVGDLYGWEFTRAWYYWVATGPGIPPVEAEALHATHGQQVRVGCPSPLEWYKGFAVPMYHVDTQEGLNALAAVIRTIGENAKKITAQASKD